MLGPTRIKFIQEGGYSVLVGKPDGKRPLGRPRRRWEDNTEIDLKVVGRAWFCVNVDEDGDDWRALVNLDRPSGCIKYREFLD